MKKDLLAELETLVGSLICEANLPKDAESGGPEFSDRLKAVDAATRFLIVKNKLAPPDKAKSLFEGLRDDILDGAPSGRTRTSAKGKGRAAAPVPDDADDD